MTRGRRGQPRTGGGFGPDAGRAGDIQPDPSRIGGVAEAPFVRLPDPASLFAARARRLAVLAPGHTLEAYLLFLADVVTAQSRCVTSCPPPAPVPLEQAAMRVARGLPPISREHVLGREDFAATLTGLLDRMDMNSAPEAARSASAEVRAMPGADRSGLAANILEGACSFDLVAESVFVAAALQVHLSRLAGRLDAAALKPTESNLCPACGSAPVSSVVVGWTQASKARYCVCSLCGTLWNHVRIKCTACGETQGIAYYTIDEGQKTIGIETCSACHCYIKHLQQHEDPQLDPLADDVASYALDLLARQQDLRRSGVNPLFLIS